MAAADGAAVPAEGSQVSRTFPLDGVRADGWFERLGAGSPAFEQLCDIVGPTFVAFAMVAGLRITALAVDQRMPDSSTIEFTVGDSGAAQKLTLGDFRRRLVQALIAEEDLVITLEDEPTVESVQAFLGVRHVLLAPIFGIFLDTLRVEGSAAWVTVRERGVAKELRLDQLWQLIRDRVRGELARHRQASNSPFAIDLSKIPEAEAAADKGRYDEVVRLIGSWPGPLALLLRTAEGQGLAGEGRTSIAEALSLLGTAYVRLNKPEWAEEVLRLGIQWGQDGPVTGKLFARLGEAHQKQARGGEAIGLFRRALALGAPRRDVMPLLAMAFASRDRRLAAIACADIALREGAVEASLVRSDAAAMLGEPWSRYAAFMKTDAPDTERPPPSTDAADAMTTVPRAPRLPLAIDDDHEAPRDSEVALRAEREPAANDDPTTTPPESSEHVVGEATPDESAGGEQE